MNLCRAAGGATGRCRRRATGRCRRRVNERFVDVTTDARAGRGVRCRINCLDKNRRCGIRRERVRGHRPHAAGHCCCAGNRCCTKVAVIERYRCSCAQGKAHRRCQRSTRRRRRYTWRRNCRCRVVVDDGVVDTGAFVARSVFEFDVDRCRGVGLAQSPRFRGGIGLVSPAAGAASGVCDVHVSGAGGSHGRRCCGGRCVGGCAVD